MNHRNPRMDKPTDEQAETLLAHALFGEDGEAATDASVKTQAEEAEYPASTPDDGLFGAPPLSDDGAANGVIGAEEPPLYGAEAAEAKLTEMEHALPPDDGGMPEEAAVPDDEFAYAPQPEPRRVEPFVPTEAFYGAPHPRRRRRKKRSPLWLLFILLGLGLLVAGLYIYRVRYNPSTFFDADKQPVKAQASANVTPNPAGAASKQTPGPTATPTPTLDPYAALVAQADETIMQNIVNILVIGVDYAEERETWSGKKAWHSDVMMVLAVNFDEKRADLISLPRDTYANIPGVKGVYKLNAAINCGGGMDAEGGAGFLKVCEAASWMLGGIPVDYYYAVTMPAVKGLVDAVGGVDYDLEMSYTMMGRRYFKGQQHMDGQAVLDYLRVRKNIAKSGDVNRVNRQKKMMVALFSSMQQQNLILKIPELVSSFNGQLFTNCTVGQTAALASFAYDLDRENIGMYSMTSKNGGNTNIFNWNFCLTDQPKRVSIIKEVYGIDVREERAYTPAFAHYRWAEMRADQCQSTGQRICDFAADCIANGTFYSGIAAPGGDVIIDDGTGVPPSDPFGGDVTLPTDDFTAGGVPDAGAVGARAELLPAATSVFRIRPGGGLSGTLSYTGDDMSLYENLKAMLKRLPGLRAEAASEAERYVNYERDSFPSELTSVESTVDDIQTTATQLAMNLGYGGSVAWGVRYERDRSFNEIAVDFN